MAVTASGYAVTLGIYTAIATGVLIFFGVARTSKFTKKFYAPKCYSTALSNRPSKLPWSFIGWIVPVLSASPQDIVEYAGVDSLLLVRIILMGIKVFAILSILCCAIILPINLTGGNVDMLLSTPNNKFDLSNFDKMTMTNIPSRSNLLYAHVCVTYAITLALLVLLWHMCEVAVALRIRHLEERDTCHEAFTVMVQDVPGVFVGTPLHRFGTSLLFFVPKKSREVVALKLAKAGRATGAWMDRQNKRMASVVKWLMNALLALVAWLDRNLSKTVVTVGTGVVTGVVAAKGEAAGALKRASTNARAQGGSGMRNLPSIASRNGSVNGSPQRFDDYQLDEVPEEREKSGASCGQDSEYELKGITTASNRTLSTAPSPPLDLPRSTQDTQEHGGDDPQDKAHRPVRAMSRLSSTGEGPQTVFGIQLATRLSAWQQAEHTLKEGITITQMVEREFDDLYGDDVSVVHLVHDTTDLDPLVKEYERLSTQLGDMFDGNVGKVRRGKQARFPMRRVIGARYGSWGLDTFGSKPVKVPVVEFGIKRLEYLQHKILEQQQVARKRDAPAAFVTFRNRKTQVLCSCTLQHHDTSAWMVKPAPPPAGVIWNNLRLRQWERSMRYLLILCACIVLALFYMIPVAAVQTLLGSKSVMDTVDKIPILASLYAAILPGLALQLFSSLLPIILRILTRLEGRSSRLDVDLGVVNKYFTFQVVIVLFGTLITGSLVSQLKQFIDKPSSILNILGTAAPQTSIFFLTYITLQALVTTPISWLRLFGVFVFWLRSRLSYGERAKRRVWENQDLRFGDDISTITFNFLLGIVYSPIMPIMAPISLLYGIVLLLTWKHDVMYVFTQQVKGGARLWQPIFNQFVAALLCMQSIMAAIIAIKEHITAACLIIPQPVITLLVALAAHRRFSAAQLLASLRAATDTDKVERQLGGWGTPREDGEANGDRRSSASSVERKQQKVSVEDGLSAAYLNPVFKFDSEAHEALLKEARFWLTCIQTGIVDEQGLCHLYPLGPSDDGISSDEVMLLAAPIGEDVEMGGNGTPSSAANSQAHPMQAVTVMLHTTPTSHSQTTSPSSSPSSSHPHIPGPPVTKPQGLELTTMPAPPPPVSPPVTSLQSQSPVGTASSSHGSPGTPQDGAAELPGPQGHAIIHNPVFGSHSPSSPPAPLPIAPPHPSTWMQWSPGEAPAGQLQPQGMPHAAEDTIWNAPGQHPSDGTDDNVHYF